MNVRSYQPADYPQVAELYKQSDLYGGQFDENRDGEMRLQKRIEADPDAIFVAEQGGAIVGTVSLIDDGRVAWLFRFAVQQGDDEATITQALCHKALAALKAKGHNQVLVYTPVGNEHLDARYTELGFSKGGDYTCFWKDI
ncbi:MAG TPA: GNAT family N-acetyltransferase [Candidatus Saccharimonadales bacterium]|nr:GNAT family N-acetyltransferase [Candidatus Saccharimonadales bacterium]